uniref:Uncharacterized protein n=1 Tax=Timema monikensis TaxID=170555 RepID=A0A7R9EDB2_9NEOP|nr:unnamed protein product [Timema monikensis]
MLSPTAEDGEIEEVHPYLRGERVENHIGKTTFSKLDRDSSPDILLVDGSLVYCEGCTLDHAATKEDFLLWHHTLKAERVTKGCAVVFREVLDRGRRQIKDAEGNVEKRHPHERKEGMGKAIVLGPIWKTTPNAANQDSNLSLSITGDPVYFKTNALDCVITGSIKSEGRLHLTDMSISTTKVDPNKQDWFYKSFLNSQKPVFNSPHIVREARGAAVNIIGFRGAVIWKRLGTTIRPPERVTNKIIIPSHVKRATQATIGALSMKQSIFRSRFDQKPASVVERFKVSLSCHTDLLITGRYYLLQNKSMAPVRNQAIPTKRPTSISEDSANLCVYRMSCGQHNETSSR